MGTLRTKIGVVAANGGQTYKIIRIVLGLATLAALAIGGVAAEPVVWPG